jgi:hypothetical protein
MRTIGFRPPRLSRRLRSRFQITLAGTLLSPSLVSPLAVTVLSAGVYSYPPQYTHRIIGIQSPPKTNGDYPPLCQYHSVRGHQALETSSNRSATVLALGRSLRSCCQQLSVILQRESVKPTVGWVGRTPFSTRSTAVHGAISGKGPCPQINCSSLGLDVATKQRKLCIPRR